jgi:hypothetical protein
MYSQMNRPTKLQLSEQERRGEITAAEYYRALEERSGAIDFAAKKRKAGTDKDKRDRNDPKCNTGNYQCRGKKGVACIPKSKGCRADLGNVNPARKAYIDATIKALQAEGAKPTIARVGRKLGAPSVQLTPEQYGKALELNISQRSLIRGDATREQLRAIGVDIDGLQPPAPKPQTKLEKAKAEQDARAKLTDTPAGRFLTVDAASLTTDTKPDPAIVDLIERSNGILLRPPVLSESGLEEFNAVTNPEIAAAAKAAYERSGNTALEMFPAIVTKDPAAAQRQAALLANDTGVEIPSSYIDPRGGMSAEKRADFDTASARFSTMDLALIRDPNAATRNFDPTEIDTLAREMLASGDTIAPIPLAMTKPIGEGVDGDGEYAPIAGFKALAAANRARELDPMFDKVASNFVDLDNPAEVEQLRRFYGGEGTRSTDEAGTGYNGSKAKGEVSEQVRNAIAQAARKYPFSSDLNKLLEMNPIEDFSPWTQEYIKAKQQHPNAVVFKRIGDFYEALSGDAVTAAEAASLVLAEKSAGKEVGRVPMVGLPAEAMSRYADLIAGEGFDVVFD